MTASENVSITQTGQVGRITLNRPKALNALTLGMVQTICAALEDWKTDDSASLVIFDAAEGRAFCAGGDIGEMYRTGREGNYAYGHEFWRTEYQLNHLIATYPKPTVSIVDGIVMGGGVGIAAHCTDRIMTENALFAMPECSIGLVPDIGASVLLARTPGRCGEYLALTGTRLSGSDCLYAGLCDHYVKSSTLAQLESQIISEGRVPDLAGFSQTPEFTMDKHQAQIDEAFGLETIPQICAHLERGTSDWAQETAKKMKAGAPMSLLMTLSLVRAARSHRSLMTALRDEFRFVSRAAEMGEFLEGTRAAIIDKDRSPAWQYPTVDSVPEELMQEMRSPAPGGDLEIYERPV
ncbi:enoyl-CoA hydratase/isomerase family protein [Roseovarius dicentrarchi]|uniref:enoyl-CoA hydratase/isomerase family protein n=1 Tax=Roseovarius dicentrarchi TaxID=2250573 RepID=UPI000DEB9DCE|nr:enoyl-CoA hydratase/isomerase family protein [Roseovarius dicentrarchi]